MKTFKYIVLLLGVLLSGGTAVAASGDPYITVTPQSLGTVTANLGETVTYATLHIKQGNVTGTTTFYLTGYNPDQFRLSATSLPADRSEIDLVITYAPTKAGSHSAVLNIDNVNHTVLFQSVSLKGKCVNSAVVPAVSVVPAELPAFSVVAGNEVKDTFTVTAANCKDYVYLRVDHIQGAAFSIDGTMVGKNATQDIVVRFAPKEEGEYQSTVTIYTEDVEDIVITLRGTGVKRDETNIDWLTHFQWDESHPLTRMNETFDNISHNKTLVLDGWQNVAAVDQRPWWGFDEDKTSPKRGTERYAKATTYQYGKDSTGTWEMFLVTPALDYKNAEGKIFAFSVMAEYLPESGSSTALELYYVDATGGKAYFQDLTESVSFPSVDEDNNIWWTYFLNLEPYAETMADVFHIAFRYVGANGGAGAVTYYIDNVSWGRTDLPEIRVEPYTLDSTVLHGHEKILGIIQVTGRNLTNEITLGLIGANYDSFNLSEGTLPMEGGTFTVSFVGKDDGKHEAYIFLRSKGAVDAFVPLTVYCNTPSGVEDIGTDKTQNTKDESRKLIRDGQVMIIIDNKQYNVSGIINR